jgi:hypothetical protein
MNKRKPIEELVFEELMDWGLNKRRDWGIGEFVDA